MQRTRWAILGPGQIGGFFARALPRSTHGVLQAVGSTDPDRARAFADEYGAPVAGTYADVLARDDVDAVYIATVHTTHAELSVAALESGKAVLCEKPVSPSLSETMRVLAAAAATGRPFVEAYKYRFGPFAAAFDDVIRSRRIGGMRALAASFGFAAGSREGRLFDPAVAGGAILDVGGYPMSLVVAVAAAAGIDLDELHIGEADGVVGAVDETARARVVAGTFVADLRASIVEDLPKIVTLEGGLGTITSGDLWGSRLESGRTFGVRTESRAEIVTVSTLDPFAAEADAVSAAIADGRSEAPQMPWAQSVATARLLADWRASLRP
ncbi:Gfo/Idh/MocA family oxidoreductase [Microbacterium sp. cx-55]|uniref:Gfo/Idh/MocA family protein n=1 Tax=Microbacterium sp. cx-55 TaxID=2875948 RepID=UPI001CBDE47D|nr:Gfo/Idh/MocA family oxidoreductase [Microbacterium sp. cx-55]MBZ4487730.1 Gfo/Idh/MocA family oxidoreductase [Microbacterium sp. cx-55]UGB34859.1 Gfo/Idh/MocA family oxidoreductase [Microbacterium sp. cx-55]